MYKLLTKDGMAKRGEFETVHGTIQTPVFMNVGTVGAIKGAVSTDDLRTIGTQVELSNTYHLHVRTGDKLIKQFGGLHKFMGWDKPSSRADRTYIQNSVDRTTRWLERCKKKMQELNSLPDTVNPHQMLFGINQGGIFADIRIEHAKRISELDLDGYAVGGLAVGETHDEMYYILDEVVPYLPENKPTYLMGVGTPANIIEAVDRGIDFFDCVYPSRNGRHGHVYTHHGKLNLFNKKFELDPRPIEEGCQCPACRTYSRAYIRHLLKAKEMLGMRLCVLHNLYFYNHLMEEIRGAIDEHRYKEFKKTTLEGFLTPEEEYR